MPYLESIWESKRLGQYDHKRFYGRDLRNKIQDSGFIAEEFIPFGEDCVKYGLDKGDVLFILTKPLIIKVSK